MHTNDEARKIIGRTIRKLRGDMSLGEVARACSTEDWKCYPSAIQEIESGERMPGMDFGHRLAEVFGVTLNDILPPSTGTRSATPKPHITRAAKRVR